MTISLFFSICVINFLVTIWAILPDVDVNEELTILSSNL